MAISGLLSALVPHPSAPTGGDDALVTARINSGLCPEVYNESAALREPVLRDLVDWPGVNSYSASVSVAA